jgi:hypothetical protein
MLLFTNIFIMVLFFVLLVFGIVLSKKYSFKAGFYAFLLLLITKMIEHTEAFFPFTELVINFIGVSVLTYYGEVMALFYIIITTLELIAITILIVGLYKMWTVKK